MNRLVFLLLVGLPGLSLAQVMPTDLWHDGKVVIDTGDTIRGAIKYDLQDLLQVRHQNQMESFSARKVLLFEIFDQMYKRYRTFYALPYSAKGGYKSPVFFEILTEGKITLLTREKIEYRSYNSPFMYGAYTTRQVLVNTYFLLKEDGNIIDFTARRNDWFDLMGSRAEQMRDYVKDNKLDLDRKYHIKQMIDYYNSLF